MRCWHKDLIPVLPRQQLMGQWRECCAIAKRIEETGTPGHILVNRIKDYPLGHFVMYASLVYSEMKRRGYSVDKDKFMQHFAVTDYVLEYNKEIFLEWHNERYLRQCLANLSEKHDCGGIPEGEWIDLYTKYSYEIEDVNGVGVL